MKGKDSDSLILNTCGGWLSDLIKKYRTPLLSALTVCLLTYMFTLTNKLVNFDDVYCVFSRGGTLESGRWGLYMIWRFLPNLSMPWLHGILTVVLLCVSACVIVSAFEIRSGLIQCLVSGLFVSFPSMIGIITYMFDASAYAFALLFCVVSVALVLKLLSKGFMKDNGIKYAVLYTLAAISLCALSLSIYQAFFALYAALFLIAIIRDLLYSEEQVGQVFRKGLLMLGFLAAAFLAYYGVLLFFWHRHHMTGGSYIAHMTDTGDQSILELLYSVYLFLPKELASGAYGLISTRLSQVGHLLIFGYILFDFIFTALRRKVWRSLFAAAVLLLLPLSVCAFLIVSGKNAHSLMFFSFTAYYILVGVMLDARIAKKTAENRRLSLRSLLLNVTTITMAFLIGNSIFVGNSAFLKLYLAYENSYSFYGTIVTQVKSLPGLNSDCKLAIIGEATEFVTDFDQFPASDSIMGATGFEVNDYSYDRFIKNFLGFSISFASQEEVESVTTSETFQQMPVYPYHGSVQIIDNIVVVKLSDPKEPER